MVSAHILVFVIYPLKEMGRLLLIYKQLLGGKKVPSLREAERHGVKMEMTYD